LCTAIWIGYDDPKKKLGGGFQYGGSACGPIWGRMMAEISRKFSGFYDAGFAKPQVIQDIELCNESGDQAVEACPNKKLYPVNFLKLKAACRIH
jgi:membrane carboxypeptidase/penicillin-binding protein